MGPSTLPCGTPLVTVQDREEGSSCFQSKLEGDKIPPAGSPFEFQSNKIDTGKLQIPDISI